jgi:hypothetical protein
VPEQQPRRGPMHRARVAWAHKTPGRAMLGPGKKKIVLLAGPPGYGLHALIYTIGTTSPTTLGAVFC